MTTSLFCAICGALLTETTLICASCGSPVDVTSQNTPASQPAPAAQPSAIPVSPCTLPPGSLLARRYQILQQLGEGGFATVYKARDRAEHNRVVAIKQIHLETSGLQGMLDASDAYNREVNHLSQLRYKHLPRIYAHFMDEQHWYIVIEYIAGKTLEEILRTTRRGFLPVQQVLDIGIVLCDTLQYLHTQRPPLIFRDVKPANIILTRSGKPYLIDFGTIKPYRPGWKDTGPLGTPGYAAPEQYGSRAHTTPQTDIYGLGATLQTLLTGQEPLEILQDGIDPARTKRIPPALLDELTHMQAREATRRPRNMAEVKAVFQEIKARFLNQKIKATSLFLWETLRETSAFACMSLLLLVMVDLAAFIDRTWQPLWLVSLLVIVGFTLFSSRSKLYDATLQNQGKLPLSEKIAIIWKRLCVSLSISLLVSMPLYYFFYMLNLDDYGQTDNYVLTNLVTIGIIITLGVGAGLFWLLRQLFVIRAARKKASQQKPPVLLHQHVHNRH